MRTPEEKERLILKYRNFGIGINQFACQHGINKYLFWKWIKKYNDFGIVGLKSNTGKKATGRPKAKLNQIEKLQKGILSYSLSSRKGDTKTYYDGLKIVLDKIKTEANIEPTILHTDQGSVYASISYNKLIEDYNIKDQ